MSDRVAAVVVTRDRRDLLRQCLRALLDQDRPPDDLVLVDNCSSDGTAELVRTEFPEARLLALEENCGSAGGFGVGLRAAHEAGADWTYLVDDDSIAAPDALRRLLAARRAPEGLPAPALLASRVVWTDGRAHPMNLPTVRRRDVGHLVAAARERLVALRATTFVGLLVSRGAIERHGLPPEHFFFQADDIDWTARLLRHEQGYLVPDSVVEHRTQRPHTALTDSGVRFSFHLRNTLLTLRGDSWSWPERLPLAAVALTTTASYLRAERCRPRALGVVGRAVRDGVRLPPGGAGPPGRARAAPSPTTRP